MSKPKSTRDRDIRFIFHAAIFSLLFMALMHVIHPLVSTPDPRIEPFVQELVPVSASEVPAMLTEDGKPAMLVLYASWCRTCRMQMPGFLSADVPARKIFISIDKNLLPLSSYLVSNEYHEKLTPYVLRNGELSRLVNGIQAMGGHFIGAIPYVAISDGKGRIVFDANSASSVQLKEAVAGVIGE